jgi:DNA primase large subunit
MTELIVPTWQLMVGAVIILAVLDTFIKIIRSTNRRADKSFDRHMEIAISNSELLEKEKVLMIQNYNQRAEIIALTTEVQKVKEDRDKLCKLIGDLRKDVATLREAGDAYAKKIAEYEMKKKAIAEKIMKKEKKL